MGFSRQEYWSGLPFPSPLRVIMIPYSGIQNVRVLRSTHTSALVTASLTTGPQGRHHCSHFTAAEAEAQRGEAKFRELTVIQQQAGAVAWPPVRALARPLTGQGLCGVLRGPPPGTSPRPPRSSPASSGRSGPPAGSSWRTVRTQRPQVAAVQQ